MTDKVKQELLSHFESLEIAVGKQVFKKGQFCDKLYFLENGLVRSFHHHGAKEVTSWFYVKDQFFTSWHSFVNGARTLETFETLEPSRIRVIDKEQYDAVLASNPEFERFGRQLAEMQLSFLDWFSLGYSFMSAADKYEQFHQIFPGLEGRVNLGLVASFIGISQETLSRIRSGKRN